MPTLEAAGDEVYLFGPYELYPRRRLLLCANTPVPIRSRAFDILCLLVEHAGDFVSQAEILNRAWPLVHVSSANVRVQISELRRALGHRGKHFVVSATNRGYSFVAPVERKRAIALSAANPAPGPPPTATDFMQLPIPPEPMFGRSAARRILADLVSRHRLVTIVGPGGVGKTTLAVAAASGIDHGPEGIGGYRAAFVDLGRLQDGRAISHAFASALGITLVNDDSVRGLVHRIGTRRQLVVVDNCEHLIGAVADLLDAILLHAPDIRILATSREPLRIAGERVYRLKPLASPETTANLTLGEAKNYPAIALFIERAKTRCSDRVFCEADVEHLVDICRRLDGLPLALELAATRLDAFGTRGLADILAETFEILTKGRRSAHSRQQTLNATITWSYNLLGARDRMLFRRLSVFASPFTLPLAEAVAGWGGLSAVDVAEGLSDLVAQSLLHADAGGHEASFSFLATTKAYARARLAVDADFDGTARRHAALFTKLLLEADESQDGAHAGAAARLAPLLDDVRAGLKWAFGPAGDVESGVALTVAAIPFWLRLSLVNECQLQVTEAQARRDGQGAVVDAYAMKLQTAHAWSLMYKAGAAHKTGAAWERAHSLARSIGDQDYLLQSLWGLWAAKMKSAEFVAAYDAAKRFSDIVGLASHSPEFAIADRILGTSLHFLGKQSLARFHTERMLAGYHGRAHHRHLARYQVSPQIAGLTTLSRILWLQGFPDQASNAVEMSVAAAHELDHRLSLCFALAQAACPIALLNGDLSRAAGFINILLEETARHGLDVWHLYANAYQGQLSLLKGDHRRGIKAIQAAFEGLNEARFLQHHAAFGIMLAEGLMLTGRAHAATRLIDDLIERSQQSGDNWMLPEMIRLRGLNAVRRGNRDHGEADLRAARGLAREHGSVAWERRAILSLAESLQVSSQTKEACELLAYANALFSEGFETADYKLVLKLLSS